MGKTSGPIELLSQMMLDSEARLHQELSVPGNDGYQPSEFEGNDRNGGANNLVD